MDNRAELERLRKLKRLRELESRVGGHQDQAVSAHQEQSTPMSHRIGAALGGGLKGATLGASDHIEAGLSSLIPIDRMVSPDGSSDIRFGDYKGNLEQIRQRNQKQKEAAPLTYAGGQVGGSIAGVGKLTKVGALPSAMIKGRGLKASTAALGLDGAAIAGVDAVLNGRDNAGKEALSGGALGAGLNVVTRGAGSAIAPLLRGKKPPVPTTQDLLSSASSTRKQLKDLGAIYSPDQLKQLALGITDDIPVNGIDAVGGKVGGVAKRIVKNTDRPASLEQLDKLRQRIDLPATASNTDKKLAGNLRRHIDDFMQGVDPSGTTGAKVKSILDESRQYTRRGRGAERLENIITEARDNVGGTLGGRLKTQEDVRRQLKQLMKSKDFNYYTKSEQDSIRQLVRGNGIDHVARLLGKAQPTGVVSGGIGGAAIMSGPAGVAVPVVGTGARQLADHRTRKGMQDLIRQVQAGSKQAASRPETNISKAISDRKAQEDLARILATMGITAN